MQQKVLDKEGSQKLRVYLAWVPMFRGMERDVPRASRAMPDPRTSHYWDGDSLLGKGFRKTLALPEDAWDVFFLYGPDAKWDGTDPPLPDFWMHQLGSKGRPRLNGPYLDADIFLQHLQALIGPVPES